MKFRILFLLAMMALTGSLFSASAQIDTVLGQVSASDFETYAGGITGDGRFIVIESEGNIATVNPRNSDGNREIFLFDYAQRQIFQITDTKRVRIDRTGTHVFSNTRVDIVNERPVISRDGRWIAFGSNATTSTPTAPNNTNPGNFDGDSFTATDGTNPLTQDGNTEMWLYEVCPAASCAITPADLSSGAEIPFVDLSGGTFIRVTNTLPSRPTSPGSTSQLPGIGNDNFDASISDNGSYIAFVSNRDLVPCEPTPTATCGNEFPDFDNPEIYTYVRTSGTFAQVTATPRGTVASPIRNLNPTISGNGLRVTFYSNAENPIVGMTGGSNSGANKNDEIYFADLDASGNPTGIKRQVTTTTPTTPGQVLNLLSYGKRMSRDGRYIAFDSYADLADEHEGANQTGFATYIYDTTLTTDAFRRVLPRSDADAGAPGGDVARYPGFTDNDENGTPSTFVLETRMNIKPDGIIAATASEGLNPDSSRPVQIYSYPLSVPVTTPPTTPIFTRRTKLPTPFITLAAAQPLTTDSVRRMSFNLGLTETGTGNLDLSTEVFYLLTPVAVNQTPASFSYSTGASRIPVTNSPVPTPTATPTPSPSPTGSPSPTPTPQTPPAVQGISPGMLAIVDYQSGVNTPVTAIEAVGSLERRFTLPIELSGVSMTINGAACGLKRVSQRQIIFVVPPGLSVSSQTNTAEYPVVINNNGTVIKGTITIVPARPDIFTNSLTAGPGGRARVFNATNAPFLNGEPFTVTTIKRKGGRRVPTVLRLYITGVNLISANSFDIRIRIGDRTIMGAALISGVVLREPGVYTYDVTLPPELDGAGDVPIIYSVTVNGVTYTSRLDDTAPRTRIL